MVKSGEVVPETTMHTQNMVHECCFKWTIDKVFHQTKKEISSSFSIGPNCPPTFKVIAKFNLRFPEVGISNINVGVERGDHENVSVQAAVDIKLQTRDGDTLCKKETRFTCSGGDPPTYIFSELFGDFLFKLHQPRSYTYDATKEELFPLRAKNLVASYNGIDRIFKLPGATLVVSGTIKTYGCCVITKDVPILSTYDQILKKRFVTNLLSDLANAYINSKKTDLELIVGSDSIKAHKTILQLRSPVFRKMFEYDTAEKKNGKVEITDVSIVSLDAMVWYLYTSEVKKLSFVEICDLYEASDKYELFSLMKACGKSLESFLDEETSCRVLHLADLHSDRVLVRAASDKIVEIFADIKDKEEWKLIVAHNPVLASDVLKKVFEHYPPGPAVIYTY